MSTDKPLRHIFFDNIKDSITGHEKILKDEILRKLFSYDFSEGPSLELLQRGDFYVSTNPTSIGPIQIPYSFCLKPGAEDMDPNYIFDSMNGDGSINSDGSINKRHITLMSYYEDLTNIHTIITFNIEQHPITHDYGVYIDALCVNNVAKYKGAKILLNEFIESLHNVGIAYVRLTAVPSQPTIDFYDRNNFQTTGTTDAEGLIEYVRMVDENSNISPSNLASQIVTMKATTPSVSTGRASFVFRIRPMRSLRSAIRPEFVHGTDYDKAITRAVRTGRITVKDKDKPKETKNKTKKGGKMKKGGKTKKGVYRKIKTRKTLKRRI